jgi:uncharacterized membrane protein YedE/YeeE
VLILTSLLAGLLFGIGLIVSGMANPGKVLGFLDLAGSWDPSLMFVMGGAIAVGLVSFAIAKRRTVSFLGELMRMPDRRDIDRRLVVGSALFGIGWGTAGFCPGPALVSLAAGHPKAILFVVSMVAGMGIFEFLEMRRATKQNTPPESAQERQSGLP